jgi:hypothetical protein
METKIHKVPVPTLMSLIYQLEKTIEAEGKTFEEFTKEFAKLKKLYKASIKPKK